jgi:hypothetical protein
MERKAGLCRVQRIGHIADAPLTEPQTLKDREPGFIRERMEQCSGAAGYKLELCSHTLLYQLFLIRQELPGRPHSTACE